MTIARVLVVDDEKALREFVRRNLEARDYSVITASNGLEALARFNTQPTDLVILDVMMPHMDGQETLRRIRQRAMTPVIVLSALGEENDIIQALNLGADDYLTKPFGVRELMARVRAVLRRARFAETDGAQDGRLVRGVIEANLERHSVRVRGEDIETTPTEFKLLVFLMEQVHKVVSHRDLLRHVWGPEYAQEAEYLRVYIGRLRQKLEIEPARPQILKTIRGVGYMLDL